VVEWLSMMCCHGWCDDKEIKSPRDAHKNCNITEDITEDIILYIYYIYIRLKPVKTGCNILKNRSKPVVAVPVPVFENFQKSTTGSGPGFPNLDQKPDLTGL
jgi:hypothetical protein